MVFLSLLANGRCCLVLPNLSAALLVAAPLRALFFTLAFADNICRWRFFRCRLLVAAALCSLTCPLLGWPLRALFLAFAFAIALANKLFRWRFFLCWLLVSAAWGCLTCPLLCWPLRLCALSSSPSLSHLQFLLATSTSVTLLLARACSCTRTCV